MNRPRRHSGPTGSSPYIVAVIMLMAVPGLTGRPRKGLSDPNDAAATAATTAQPEKEL
jgi:hypothetical protein